MLLGPFEQLEREFGWEGGPAVPIRPPSAFCSLADIQEDGEKAAEEDLSEECKNQMEESDGVSMVRMSDYNSDLVKGEQEAVSLNDSGVCDLQEGRLEAGIGSR
jgi:hypothetical protein